ncbi:MAG TPA: universal stress protein, partial [Longimicrobiales bacterium]|nr:universal stress protein [Longimicrobiales bacterium]
MYRSLAVPLDGTEDAGRAAEWAASLALRWEARLHLVRLPGADGAVPAGLDAAPGAGRGLRVRTVELEAGRGVAAALEAFVRRHRVDLVVTPARLAGYGRRAARLCERVPVPVLELPAGAADETRMRRMLVALDGGKPAEQILPFVAALNRLLGAQLTLVTVVAPSYVIGAGGGASVDCEVERKRAAAGAYLDGVARLLAGRGCVSRTRVLVRARPAGAIADLV